MLLNLNDLLIIDWFCFPLFFFPILLFFLVHNFISWIAYFTNNFFMQVCFCLLFSCLVLKFKSRSFALPFGQITCQQQSVYGVRETNFAFCDRFWLRIQFLKQPFSTKLFVFAAVYAIKILETETSIHNNK